MTAIAASMRRGPLARVRRVLGIMAAFLRLGLISAIAYPLGFVLRQFKVLIPAIVYFFVARLVGGSGANVGGDYYTFVIVGLIGSHALDAGLRSLSNEVTTAINRGWFEMILVEPVRWRFLPFGLVLWPVAQTMAGIVLLFLVALPLGAEYAWSGLLPALAVIALGILAGMCIGIVAAGLKVLAKSGDPLITVYVLAAQVLSGVFFPLDVLPSWLRPISWLLPHTYVISSLRRVLMPEGGEMPGVDLATTTGALLAFNIVFLPLAVWAFGRAMEYGRKLGVLSGY